MCGGVAHGGAAPAHSDASTRRACRRVDLADDCDYGRPMRHGVDAGSGDGTTTLLPAPEAGELELEFCEWLHAHPRIIAPRPDK